MRTTLDIPSELLATALEVSRLPTKREAVVEGLKELIRKARREQLRRSAGSEPLDIDVGRARKRAR